MQHPITRRTVLAGAAVIAAPLVRAQTPIVIKFSHVVAPNTPKGQAAERFKALAEKGTGGRVKIEIYPNSQLYKDGEELAALQLGSVQMLAPSLSKFGPLGVKDFETFDLPYIFPDAAALRKITDGPIGARMLSKLEPKGIKGLAYWDNGFKIMTSNRLMARPEDMKGLKMRIQSSKVLEAQMRALSAIPQVMAFSEVYQGLQSGVVDGTENTPSNVYTQKYQEVQKHMTLSDHGYIGYAVVVNKKFWDALAPDIRAALEAAMKQASALNNEIAKKDNDDSIAGMKATGKVVFHTLTADEKQAWIARLKPVHKEMASRVGPELIQEIYRATGQK